MSQQIHHPQNQTFVPPVSASAPPGPVAPQQTSWAPPAQQLQPQPPTTQAPVKDIGILDTVPCPYCGASTTGSSDGWGSYISHYLGGAAGWMLFRAAFNKYICPTHGEIPKEAFPEQHRRMISLRRAILIGGAGTVLTMAFLLIMLSALLEIV